MFGILQNVFHLHKDKARKAKKWFIDAALNEHCYYLMDPRLTALRIDLSKKLVDRKKWYVLYC